MNIGNAIKQRRKELGIKQNQLAEASNISQTYLSQIESNSKEASSKVISDICNALNIPIAILIWKSIENSDISPRKLDAFKMLKPSVDGLINSFIDEHDAL